MTYRSFMLFGVLSCTSAAHAQLRIVQYNAGDVKPGLGTILEQIGRENVNGIAKPIDVLIVEEQQSATYVTNIVNVLNGIYGPGTYAAAPYVGITSGGGLPSMIYRPSSLSLISSTPLGTVGTTTNARQTIKYELLPTGYGADATLYLYASHLKASNTGPDATRRNIEVTTNRADADAMGPGKNILYAGDFNFYSGNEPGFTTLTSAGPGQAVDPTGAPLNWSGASHRVLFTQSPVTTAVYEGQVTGGMNDRFDFQLSSTGMNDGSGLAIIPGSYRAFGNNGTQPLSAAVNDPANTWDNPGLTVPRTDVLNALTTSSDHVPAVADYQLPAKMSATVATIAPRVITGAVVPVNVTVSNAAPVVAAIGADELNYVVSSSGAVSGSVAGTATATLVGNTHSLTLVAGAPGAANGTVNVSATSQQAANGTFTQIVSTIVLAHAKPSFTNGSGTTSLTLNFGIRAKGLPAPALPFSLFNLADLSGFTAKLDLDTILGSGQTSKLTTNLATFSNFAPGSLAYQASIDTSTTGSFNAGYSLFTSDENIPGATGLSQLTLNLQGIVALGGDSNVDGQVNIADLTALALHWQLPGTWFDGDFNRDGMVNVADLLLLTKNWQSTASLAASAAALGLPASSVPEPGWALAIGLLGAFCVSRRTRA